MHGTWNLIPTGALPEQQGPSFARMRGRQDPLALQHNERDMMGATDMTQWGLNLQSLAIHPSTACAAPLAVETSNETDRKLAAKRKRADH